MNHIIIPDLHGLTCWEIVKAIPNIDKYIFLGDYTDSFTIKNPQILENLENIIQFKLDNMDKVELLLGNHDIQYMFSPNFRCSGFRAEMLADLKRIFETNRNIFNIAYQYKNHIFTHAGICQNWMNFTKHTLKKFDLLDDLSNLGDVLNKLNHTSSCWELHIVGERRGGLRYDYGGPTWADMYETKDNLVKGLKQYVGHTPTDKIIYHEEDENTSIMYLDTLGKKRENTKEEDFYIIEI